MQYILARSDGLDFPSLHVDCELNGFNPTFPSNSNHVLLRLETFYLPSLVYNAGGFKAKVLTEGMNFDC